MDLYQKSVFSGVFGIFDGMLLTTRSGRRRGAKSEPAGAPVRKPAAPAAAKVYHHLYLSLSLLKLF